MIRFSNEELEILDENYCNISTEGIDIKPKQIIYRQLVINSTDLNKSEYRDIFVPRKYNDRTFASLIQEIAIHGYSSLYRHSKETAPLDISVYRDSVIIVQLPPTDGYWFEPPAIRLKKTENGACPTNLYGGLRYVDQHGVPHETYVEKCTLIYFSAQFVEGYLGAPYIQSFLYAVNRLRARWAIVDPDIRHPGNGGADLEP